MSEIGSPGVAKAALTGSAPSPLPAERPTTSLLQGPASRRTWRREPPARVGEVAAGARARSAPAGGPVERVRQLRPVRLARARPGALPPYAPERPSSPHDAGHPPAARDDAAPPGRRLDLPRAVPALAPRMDGESVGLDGARRGRGLRARAGAAAGRARRAEDLAPRRYRVAVGASRHRRHFRADVSAACFRASAPMRGPLLSRSDSMTPSCSGVLSSAARGEPVALMGLIHLRGVVLPRPCSRMVSPGGLPAS